MAWRPTPAWLVVADARRDQSRGELTRGDWYYRTRQGATDVDWSFRIFHAKLHPTMEDAVAAWMVCAEQIGQTWPIRIRQIVVYA